jgi:uncharacterized protein
VIGSMFRNALLFLKQWMSEKSRKPLVIRGARQVGKTWLVREFAKSNQLELIEINFELNPEKKDYFVENDPKKALLHLEVMVGRRIVPEKTLLFLDEIQSFPIMLAKLRWFKEMMPELAVIVAGSLLEFILDKHEFSMPVGRISYLHLEPLSFEEFLIARNPMMHDFLNSFHWEAMPTAIHAQCLGYFREYTLVGGLPAAVSAWLEENSLLAVNQVHHDILMTYRDDFARYKGKFDMSLFDTVFSFIPKSVSKKIVYHHISQDHQAASIKKIIHLLDKARILHIIKSTAGNGIPLAAETNDKFNKIICLDVGLMTASLGIKLEDLKSYNDIVFINNGAIAEQAVGQLLRTIEPFYIEPELYYWQRMQPTSNAEVDYLIQYKSSILPIEVKAGTKGSMQSLHLFMGLKKLSTAVRFSTEMPSRMSIDTKTSLGDKAHYKLFCLPIYMVEQLKRLLLE